MYHTSSGIARVKLARPVPNGCNANWSNKLDHACSTGCALQLQRRSMLGGDLQESDPSLRQSRPECGGIFHSSRPLDPTWHASCMCLIFWGVASFVPTFWDASFMPMCALARFMPSRWYEFCYVRVRVRVCVRAGGRTCTPARLRLRLRVRARVRVRVRVTPL